MTDEVKKDGVNIEYQEPIYNAKRKIEHSVSLQSGASGTIFKVDPKGMFVGGNKFSNAPYRLDYDGNLRMGPLTGAGLGMDGDAGTFDVYWNDAKVGSIEGFIAGDNSEDGYLKITTISGRYLKFQQSMISCNGNFNPHTDGTESLGTMGQKWEHVYADNLHGSLSDLELNDKFCPICGKEFQKGDNLIFTVREKTDENISTIPAHLKCALK